MLLWLTSIPDPAAPRSPSAARCRRANTATCLIHSAPERRLPALALAIVAVGAEDNVRSFGNHWGSAAVALRWLSYLVAAGHELTEAEQQLMDEARKELDAASSRDGEG